MNSQKINFIFLIFLIVVNIFIFSERLRGEEITGAIFTIILEFSALAGLNLFLKIYKKEQVNFLKNAAYFIASLLLILFILIYIPSNMQFCRKYYPSQYQAWEISGQLNIFQRIAAFGCKLFSL